MQDLKLASLALVGLTGVGLLIGERSGATSASGPPADDSTIGTVRSVGLMVNAPTGGGSADFPDLAFMGTFEKTRVALLLEHPAGGLIDLVPDASSLTVFRDDRGTDLRKQDAPFGPFEMMPRVAEDGRSLVFVVPSETLPDARASRLTVQGVVAALAAESTQVHRSEPAAIEDGAALTAGPWSFQLSEVGPSQWGDGWSLTLNSRTDVSTVVRYALVDGAGAEIALDVSMTMSGGGSWQQTLESAQAVERGSLLVESWKDPEVVRVPFEVSLGLGLH